MREATATPRGLRPVGDDAPDPVRREDARREVVVFLTVTFALLALSTTVGVVEDVDVSRIDEATPLGQLAMFGQAFLPLVGVVVARLTTPRPRRTGWGFRRTSWRSLGIAWGTGLVAAVVPAVICLGVGVLRLAGGDVPPVVPLGLTVLVVPYLLLAIGEDVGWRGLLVTRLAQLGGPRSVVVVSGLAWGMFHWPLLIWLGGTPDDVPTWFGLLSFTVGTTALGAVLANMQLRWGLWPVVVAHATVNAAMYHVVAELTEERAHAGWLSGEVGIVSGVVLTAVALVWWRAAPLTLTRTGGTAPAPARTSR